MKDMDRLSKHQTLRRGGKKDGASDSRPPPPLLELWDVARRLIGERFVADAQRIGGALLSSLLARARPGPGIDDFGMDPALLECLRPLFEFLYGVYFRVDAGGVHHVPAKGPAILVANHAGALPYDGVMIHLAVFNEHPRQRTVRFLVEDFVFQTPLLSGFVRKAGGVRACHENATALLGRGELIVVFPEGTKGVGKTYDERYRLRRFGRGGFVRLAMRTGAPIVPVAIIGSEEIHPIIWKSTALAKPLGLPFIPFTPTFPWLGPLGLVPLPSKWRIVFGRPVRFDRFTAADAEREALVARHTKRIRDAIQEMIDIELAKRRSVWT